MSRRESILVEGTGGSRHNTRSVSDLAAMSSVGGVPIAIDTSSLVADSRENLDGCSTAVAVVLP